MVDTVFCFSVGSRKCKALLVLPPSNVDLERLYPPWGRRVKPGQWYWFIPLGKRWAKTLNRQRHYSHFNWWPKPSSYPCKQTRLGEYSPIWLKTDAHHQVHRYPECHVSGSWESNYTLLLFAHHSGPISREVSVRGRSESSPSPA